ncbi:hypothetical protein BN903_33 [Halorubrum sp. AJ67]|nr:hypothetical protein BN903_33 [Halorubrum sp. AJ67]
MSAWHTSHTTRSGTMNVVMIDREGPSGRRLLLIFSQRSGSGLNVFRPL